MNEASPTTLHAVPNQHLHLFPIFYTLWLPPTIQNILLKLLQLNLCWEGSVMQVHSNTRRPLFGLTKALHVGGSTLRKLFISSCWKLQTTSLKESSVKNRFSKLIPTLHSKTVCVNESRGGICRKEKFPTYHKLTRHTTKSTRYSQLQSIMYCC